MRLRTVRPLLTDEERMAVVVTELLRYATGEDNPTRVAARQILTDLMDEPSLRADDRHVARAVLSAHRS